MTQFGSTAAQEIVLDRTVSVRDACQIAEGRLQVRLSNEALRRCGAAHDRLAQIIREERHVYGITTGFGPLANRLVGREDGILLQQNLVHHLASGVGPDVNWVQARSIVLARLMSILQGASGASPTAIDMLVGLLNSAFAPAVPSKGTVGASGDLTPLAHMVLCLQGRGDFMLQSGSRVAPAQALGQMGLNPLDLSRRDGLALVNGTSAMTGVAVLNATAALRAIAWSVVLTAGLAECLSGRTEAWHAAFGDLRPHPGQIAAAAALRACLAGSKRVIRTPLAERRLTGMAPQTEPNSGQDAYTLRCAPQVIGAVWDTTIWHNNVVETELQSATDNPIFPERPGEDIMVLHGGNFMGQHVGLASDALSNAIVVLAGLAERQMARLTDETLNRGLPAFLLRGPAGLNSGLMGAQVTATALLAEMRTAGAASVQSLSTNGANQDVVSMGTIAARLLADKLTGLFQIQAILAIAVTQAVDILEKDAPGPDFSSHLMALRQKVRGVSPELLQDRPLGREIEVLAEALAQSDPPKP